MMKPRKPQWPDPADTPLDRARRIATTYRSALNQLDPHRTDVLDKHFTDLGEIWITPQPAALDLNAMLGAADMSEHLGGHPTSDVIRQWGQRGTIPRHKDDAGRTVYRVGDLLDHLAQQRRNRATRRSA